MQTTVEEYCKSACKQYIYQLERGVQSQLLHYQGYIKLHQKMRKSAVIREIQVYLPGCHVGVASNNGEAALRTYCMKAETKVAGPWADKDLRKEQERERVAEELKYVPEPVMVENPYPWQQDLIAEMAAEPRDRRVVWVYDQQGNSGKSTFIKWQRSVHPEYRAAYRYAKATDIFNMAIDQGARKVYFFDLTRAKPHELGSQDLYSAIESIKDGFIVSGKYKGGELLFKPPHVFVFANVLPDWGCLSRDRWDVRYLRPDHTLWKPVDEHVCGGDCDVPGHNHA